VLWIGWALRFGIVAVASFVLVGLAPLILDAMKGLDACPMLGPVPACYPVGLGYIAMMIATIISPQRLTTVFMFGWAPVFLLALSGSTLQFLGQPTCPLSPTGTPLCYFSLAIASFLLPAYLFSRHLHRPDSFSEQHVKTK